MSDVETLAAETHKSLKRITNFDINTLIRQEVLGKFSFGEAVPPAAELVDLFEQLPPGLLDQLPDIELNIIKQQADSTFQFFTEILEFEVDQGSPAPRRDALLQKLRDMHQELFSNIYPLISYSMARTVDFTRLEGQGRAAVRSVRDQSEKVMQEVETQKNEVTKILDDVRTAAAEQGVSQQASYFNKEAEGHRAEADRWRKYTIWMAITVGAYGILTLFLHKIPFVAPTDIYETIQLTVGKVIVFFVLSYMLVLCAKNFTSNRHNEIVNRHRQNALMTYKTLVDAGGTPEARDIILTHAAASIYKLHETGYIRGGEGSSGSSSSIVEMLPRTSLPLSAANAAS